MRAIVVLALLIFFHAGNSAHAQSEFVEYGGRGSLVTFGVRLTSGTTGYEGGAALSILGWLEPGIRISRISHGYYKVQEVSAGIAIQPMRPVLDIPIQPSIGVFYEQIGLDHTAISTRANGLAFLGRLFASVPLGRRAQLIPEGYVLTSQGTTATAKAYYGTALTVGFRISRARLVIVRGAYSAPDGDSGITHVGIGYVHAQGRKS